MPESPTTRKTICYILILSLTAHARTAYLSLLARSWYPDPATSSTTITEEFLPIFFMHLGKTPIPTDDNLVKIIVFSLHFLLTVGCLGVYVLGMMIMLEMGILSLWEIWWKRRRRGRRRPRCSIRDSTWARDPLDLIDPAKRTLFEKIGVSVFSSLFIPTDWYDNGLCATQS